MRVQPLTAGEREQLAAILADEKQNYSFASDIGKTNWGAFPLVRVHHRVTGKASTYYRWPDSHPRSWIKQFSHSVAAGEFI